MTPQSILGAIFAAFVVGCAISALIEWKERKIVKLADQEMMRRHVSREDQGD